MSKLSLAGVSLVAAIPAGLLAWLLVDGFLNHFDKMPIALQGVAGLTLLVCALAVLLPPGVLVFGPKAAGTAAPASAKSASKKNKAAEEDLGGDAELEELDAAGGEIDEISPVDDVSDDLGEVEELSEEETLEAGSEEFDLSDMDDVQVEESDMDMEVDEDDDSRKTRRK